MKLIKHLLTILIFFAVGGKGVCQSVTPGDTALAKKLIIQAQDSSTTNIQYSLKTGMIALNMSMKLHFRKGIVKAMELLGVLNMRMGNTAVSMSYYARALDTSSRFGFEGLRATTYSNMGVLYSSLGIYEKEFDCFTKSLEIRKTLHDSNGIADSYNNIGNCLAVMAHYSDANKYFFNALLFNKLLHRQQAMGADYNNIAANFINQKKYDTGLYYLRISTSIYNKIHDTVSIEYNTIGSCYWYLGKKDSAYYFFFKALHMAEQMSDMQRVITSLGNLGGTYELDGKHDLAEKYLLLTVDKASQINYRPALRDACNALAGIDSAKGDFKDAFMYLQMAYQNNDSVLNDEKITAISEMTSRFNLKETEEKNSSLQSENDYQKLQLNHQNIFILGISITAILLVIIGLLLFRQNKIKTSKLRLELEQKQFRAQMNPHFIFNCLNSIKHFIMQNDVINAEKYLSDFASLMRQTLNNSSKDYITLRAEKEYLENYISLERMRFDNKFEFRITCASDVDMDYVEIPPMIIQPFVENAILHGLCNLNGKGGLLSISFYCKEKRLYCEVQDNGIGRDRSMQLKQTGNFPYKSMGIELTRQRLSLISKKNSTDSNIDIIDKSEAGHALGTTVVIKFPE